MGKIEKLGTYENYVFHAIGRSGGTMPYAKLRKEIATHGKNDSQAIALVEALVSVHRLAEFTADRSGVTLTKEGAELYHSIIRK